MRQKEGIGTYDDELEEVGLFRRKRSPHYLALLRELAKKTKQKRKKRQKEDYLREFDRERERWRTIRFNPTANKQDTTQKTKKTIKGIN